MSKTILFKMGSYATVLCGFILMFFLYIPSFDVFFFSRDYESNFLSFWENSLFYGNGRLLGNLIGISISHNFSFAYLIVSISLLLVVFLINKLVFDNDHRLIFPIAVAVAFPCKGIFSEVYSVYASFTNYVLPVIFLLAAWCMLKRSKNVLTFIPICFTSFVACLFSENSTIVVLISSIICLVHSTIKTKKNLVYNFSFFIGAFVGSLTMYLVPKITNTSEKLSFYREIKTEIISLIKSVVSVSLSFSNMFSSFLIPIFLCSAGLSFLPFKHSKIKSQYKTFLCFYLLFFASECLILSSFSDQTLLSIYFASLQTVLVILYALVVLLSLLSLNKPSIKLELSELYILVMLSVGPLLVVSQYGYRTFYLTFILLLVFACNLSKYIFVFLCKRFSFDVKKNLKRIVAVSSAFCFIFLSANTFIQSSYNYNFYVTRTEYIAYKVSVGAEKIYVPSLPCQSLSCEDEHPNSIENILYKTNFNASIHQQALVHCDNQESYNAVLSRNPISSIVFSLSHLEYNSPSVIFSLTETNQ